VKDKLTLDVGKPFDAHTQCETSQPRRILVVDDDADIRQLSTDVLLSYGYAVDAAEDGAVGWEALHANRYDLLITDNDMPKISGVELVQKARSEHMALPVILASGAAPAKESNQHPQLQLSATLQKPFTTDELLGTVKKVLTDKVSPA
jgi:DNA-binding NtrC family response regulator